MSKNWRQYIGVRGKARELVESASPNLLSARNVDGEPVGTDPTKDMLILFGCGAWFPAVEGSSWAAICDESGADDYTLNDITPVLWLLLANELMPRSDASPAEVASWLKGNH